MMSRYFTLFDHYVHCVLPRVLKYEVTHLPIYMTPCMGVLPYTK